MPLYTCIKAFLVRATKILLVKRNKVSSDGSIKDALIKINKVSSDGIIKNALIKINKVSSDGSIKDALIKINKVSSDGSIKDALIKRIQPYNLIGDGPEGPECRVIAEYLAKETVGDTVLKIQWDTSSRYNKEEIAGYDEIKHLFPAIIENVTVKGKHIIFTYRSYETVFYSGSSLGMEGKFVWEPNRHSNLSFVFGRQIRANIIKRTLYFDDSRHFIQRNKHCRLSFPN